MTRVFDPPAPGTYARAWFDRLASMPPVASLDNPTMRLDVAGVTITVTFDRWDMDQPTYNWTVGVQNITDQAICAGKEATRSPSTLRYARSSTPCATSPKRSHS